MYEGNQKRVLESIPEITARLGWRLYLGVGLLCGHRAARHNALVSKLLLVGSRRHWSNPDNTFAVLGFFEKALVLGHNASASGTSSSTNASYQPTGEQV